MSTKPEMNTDPSTSAAALDPTRFAAVDHTTDPDFYVRFMEEGHRLPDIAAGGCCRPAC
jgi:hypothetical protein